MARSMHGTVVPDELERMPCGGIPLFDYGAGYGYRCYTCNAVIGSVGQPKSCVEENNNAK